MRLTDTVIDTLIEEVRRTAKAEILPHFRRLDSGKVEAKTAYDDLVTIADKAAEKALTAAMARLLPEAAVVGEEAVEENKDLLALIDSEDWTVIIDPIDGTWNYANGIGCFGVILAVTYRGETVFGLLYDPLGDDWVMASKGGGAWFAAPGLAPRAVAVSTQTKRVTGNVPLPMFAPDVQRALAPALLQFDRVMALRCSCHDYRLLSQGGSDFSVACALKPWDHAAGNLIVAEAGGVSVLMTGETYGPRIRSGTLIAAANPDVAEKVRAVLASCGL